MTVAAYATLAEARAHGATGTDAEVQAAIERASDVVDHLTRSWWDARVSAVVVQLDQHGVGRLPRPALTVTAARIVGQTYDLAPGTYQVETAAVLGGRDRFTLGGRAMRWDHLRNHDPLHYLPGPGRAIPAVQVTGTFGHDPTPEGVREATARIAAGFTGAVGVVNQEGDADLGSPPQVPTLTFTALTPEVQALLEPYLPRRVRL